MPRAMRLAIASAIVVSACACAGTDQVEIELSRMRREMQSLKAQAAEAKSEMERLEGRLTLLTAGQTAKAPSSTPSAVVPSLPVVRITGKTAAGPATEESDEAGALDDGSPPVLIKVGPQEREKLPIDHEVLKKPDPVLGKSSEKTGADMSDAYKQALGLLRDQNRPAEARVLFERLIREYPEGHLTDNAAYWLAECSALEGKHPDALRQFERVVETYPRSPKIPDALLRIADSHRALGNNDKVSEVLSRIIEQYPHSEAASKARSALVPPEGR